MKALLIEPHYFPNIQYFSKIFNYNEIIIDDLSLFEKQSYRNRMRILGANKVLSLIVPVKKDKTKMKLKDVQIDYGINWQKDHWNSIISAYNKSPFFLFYMNDFEKNFNKKKNFLIDLNIEIILNLIEILELDTKIKLLSETDVSKGEFDDLRNSIHPKKKHNKSDNSLKNIEYQQVFSERFDFIPNLSVVDLLSNKGPEAVQILMESVVVK